MSTASPVVSPKVDAVVSALVGSGGFDPNMILVMATTAAPETITIPCQNVGVFNATINWGDGTADSTITAWNDADLAHSYASVGDHTITISGTFPNIYFNNAGDKLKLKEVKNLGDTGLTRLAAAFYGCSNLTSFTGYANTSAVALMTDVFRDCSSLTTLHVSGFNTSLVTKMTNMFRNCSSLTTLDVSGFNTALVTVFFGMFRNCSSLTTLDVSGFNTDLATSMGSMFNGDSSLTTLDVSGFNTALVTAMDSMFLACSGLAELAIDGWNIGVVANLSNFLNGATLSTTRYDATLIAWDAQNPVDSLIVHFGNSKYTDPGAASTARANLIATDLWTITDGGIA